MNFIFFRFLVEFVSNVMLMNNETIQSPSYRRLPDSSATPSPVLRRTKSVRASFRMLGARWKSNGNSSSSTNALSKMENNNGTNGTTNNKYLAKDTVSTVSERFGKDFNRNLKKSINDMVERLPTTSATTSILPQSIIPAMKNKTKFFHAFAKENVNRRHIHRYEIPKNVAPKAATLLHIPVLNRNSNADQLHQQQQQNIQQANTLIQHNEHRRHDLIKANENFNVQLDRNSRDLIANSKQFALFKSLSDEAEASAKHNYRETFQLATIRRTPYWPSNQPIKHSKKFVCLDANIFGMFFVKFLIQLRDGQMN